MSFLSLPVVIIANALLHSTTLFPLSYPLHYPYPAFYYHRQSPVSRETKSPNIIAAAFAEFAGDLLKKMVRGESFSGKFSTRLFNEKSDESSCRR